MTSAGMLHKVEEWIMKAKERAPRFTGWLSTDDEEVKRRWWRGRTDIVAVEPHGDGLFTDYDVTSSSGSSYRVELRSLSERINSCGCMDYRTNRLGTCKHIEGVLYRLGQAQGHSPRIEVFVDERGTRSLTCVVPDGARSRLADRVRRLCDEESLEALRALEDLADRNSSELRVSGRVAGWLGERERRRRKHLDCAEFESRLASGEAAFDMLKVRLYDYQVAGALHLAFTERALLADEMGLGKTVQAIAAATLLRQLRGISRVLVVSPASLKAEWDDQIAKFTDLPATIVRGNLMQRRSAYGSGAFFILANYEQIRSDWDVIGECLAPDVVVLDEAQRIKNWQTKTADAVKKLKSRYAFVLTGTPIENRIDELYSIVQFLDPDLLGPLFRFNREHYVLDERGRPTGFQNLDKLSEKVSTIMLRRRKDDVEDQLPARTSKTLLVPMTDDQWRVHDDYRNLVARLAAVARKRPLSPEEFKKMQIYLACMRMSCDTLYILDDQHDECPKLEEIGKILDDLLEESTSKVVVFSEWVRMLDLVRGHVDERGIEHAIHTGSVSQERRRAEIRRFRQDPACRILLTSDSGGVGLNLQAADTVINIDQPWNPARLEQRIARVWRKHQTRTVRVYHLVAEDTIEHNMLGLLADKQALADGVLDGRGDLSAIAMPGGRRAFIERVNSVLGMDGERTLPDRKAEEAPQKTLFECLRDRLLCRHGEALQGIFGLKDGTNFLAVLDLAADDITALEKERDQWKELSEASIRMIDSSTREQMENLAKTGLIAVDPEYMEQAWPDDETRELNDRRIRWSRAQALIEPAERKLKAARLLAGGGLLDEARPSAVESMMLATRALTVLDDAAEPDDADEAYAFLVLRQIEADALDPSRHAMEVLGGAELDDESLVAVGAFVDKITSMTGDAR